MTGVKEELEAYSRSPTNRNPKLERLQEIILEEFERKRHDTRGILFCKTRDLTVALCNWMLDTDALKDLNPTRFVGVNAPRDRSGTVRPSISQITFFRWFCFVVTKNIWSVRRCDTEHFT